MCASIAPPSPFGHLIKYLLYIRPPVFFCIYRHFARFIFIIYLLDDDGKGGVDIKKWEDKEELCTFRTSGCSTFEKRGH